ncbi:uncharacterized protein P884DRAFT_189049 [Thermothelomyces heterothallicus CBS 202.75]|uniref:uncharacterized protein n=1 Tax=Thermothelomyces heterothallicus CBS 202.75 TaxID=1149848 RepID=UPI003743C58F
MPITTNRPVPAPYPVRVHHYLPSSSSSSSSPAPRPVQTYEHLISSPSSSSSSSSTTTTTSAAQPPRNALVFIGGLGDGPHTIPYVRRLAEHLAGAGSYAVFEARLSSAFCGYGHASLAQDAREIADLVRYLRRGGPGVDKVVLMGHSTGCQDCLEYAVRAGYAAAGKKEGEEEEEETWVDGLVLQGPVSDREAVRLSEDGAEVERSLRVAEEMVREGKGGEVMEKEVMPKGWRGTPVTAYRWASLVGVGGDDDYFSSDLPDSKLEEIWGKLKQPVLIVPSEKDEWVSPEADVTGLVNKWKSFCKPGIASDLSGLIPGANHRVDNEAGQQWLFDRVARFLAQLGETR